MRGIKSDVAAFLCVLSGVCVIAGSTGCDMVARSQGKFPIASSFGSEVIGPEGHPLEEHLFVPKLDANGNPHKTVRVPLVKIGYRDPWFGKLKIDGHPKNKGDKDEKDRKRHSYYMVIDVTNLVRYPGLGATSDEEFRERLRTIAEMLVVAADWNGDVYWRHLTTFLETYGALDSAAQAALGSSIAASFISPVLGASLAGGALATDTLVEEFTSSLNVEEYAAMREAASTYRRVVKGKLFQDVDNATRGSDAVNNMLQQAYDYAFTYSIKGAIYAATQQNQALENLLITGESEWRLYFQREIDRHNKRRLDLDEVTDPVEKAALTKYFEAQSKKEKADQESRTKIEASQRATAEAEAEKAKHEMILAAAKVEKEAHEMQIAAAEARKKVAAMQEESPPEPRAPVEE